MIQWIGVVAILFLINLVIIAFINRLRIKGKSEETTPLDVLNKIKDLRKGVQMERVSMSQQSQENQTGNPTCKYCQSEAVIKYGKSKDTQCYYCKACKRKFSNPNNIPKMQNSTKVIADSLNMHYEGMSLNEIRRNFIQQDGNFTSKVTPYNWEKRFTAIAEKEVEKYHPQVGEQWQADETLLHNNFGGKKKRLWVIDVLDTKTRFLLASMLSYNRYRNDIRIAYGTSQSSSW